MGGEKWRERQTSEQQFSIVFSEQGREEENEESSSNSD